MSQAETTPRTYYLTAAALFLLLGATVGATYAPLGPFAPVVALGIAAIKAALVALFFMHVRYASPLVRLAAAAGLVWLTILMLLTAADFAIRYPQGDPEGGGVLGRAIEEPEDRFHDRISDPMLLPLVLSAHPGALYSGSVRGGRYTAPALAGVGGSTIANPTRPEGRAIYS